MANPNFCHFCGRSDSLNSIPDTTAKVCSKCWELIVHIVGRFLEVLTDQAIPTNDEIILEFLKKKLENKVEQANKL